MELRVVLVRRGAVSSGFLLWSSLAGEPEASDGRCDLVEAGALATCVKLVA